VRHRLQHHQREGIRKGWKDEQVRPPEHRGDIVIANAAGDDDLLPRLAGAQVAFVLDRVAPLPADDQQAGLAQAGDGLQQLRQSLVRRVVRQEHAGDLAWPALYGNAKAAQCGLIRAWCGWGRHGNAVTDDVRITSESHGADDGHIRRREREDGVGFPNHPAHRRDDQALPGEAPQPVETIDPAAIGNFIDAVGGNDVGDAARQAGSRHAPHLQRGQRVVQVHKVVVALRDDLAEIGAVEQRAVAVRQP
jgi:hypothetical protein